ncbi:MAG: helix-turn-helix domain-containing protein [Thermoanaerobacteraceae bacterium]|uniref:Transcriptional regulator, XRE family n=1 Tax=Pseudobacteroides cellulosolvens ATCC 35603 = DSM 2933 TaxID=398512 RepID=A0A0L6JPL3_9FIRM|nr:MULTISPECIES: helix-turn-helix domain-containing protein [Clostridia]KNY27713.1 transcriptional regulator, XRE family [Pseudobacteroides cellulosolvens ATCC 35603 = DSM 2933]NLZ51904.1 helix-turn-helix domain-containing protein [Thermoanaerobacteraceae bacterium]
MENNNVALAREKVLTNMTDNLAMLRTKLGLTQVQLANLIGVSRHTIMQVENKKAKLSWNTFLSLLLVFIKNPETDRLLNILEIYTDELNNELKLRL